MSARDAKIERGDEHPSGLRDARCYDCVLGGCRAHQATPSFARGDVIRSRSAPLNGMLVVVSATRKAVRVRSLGPRPYTAELQDEADWERVPGAECRPLPFDFGEAS